MKKMRFLHTKNTSWLRRLPRSSGEAGRVVVLVFFADFLRSRLPKGRFWPNKGRILSI